ncbi:Crp/Fnr family transcriptional regulator [Moheibacter lacus]|uniref:Crp/Fnr family transcriptional regulator n=1 Tax=Moheibacter lacus TaxID=2745851 RepID=A0A838ZQZ8_9FLAO|nr:Crp/Fnr family transcriptional regulator [Moheibacter lacus]MBA5629855.1 Crp/Fnr family transcriptional regulator [Moheibacter lacus]
MINSLACIYQHPLLSKANLDIIFSAHRRIKVSKNEFLLREGEVLNSYYVLESGLVRAFVHDFDNNEITTEFFVKNEIVIVPSSLFQRIPSKENLQAVTNAVLWKIEFDDFEKLFDQIEGFKDWGRLWFTFQLFSNKQRSLDMITETATNRYLKLMKEKPSIVKSAPLKQIASYLGITDSSLSRIRREILYNSKS